MTLQIGSPAAAERLVLQQMDQWFAAGGAGADDLIDRVRRVVAEQLATESGSDRHDLPIRVVTADELIELIDVDIRGTHRRMQATVDRLGSLAEQLAWLPGLQAVVHGAQIGDDRVDHLMIFTTHAAVVLHAPERGDVVVGNVEGRAVPLVSGAEVPGFATLARAAQTVGETVGATTHPIIVVDGMTSSSVQVDGVYLCPPAAIERLLLEAGSEHIEADVASSVAHQYAPSEDRPRLPVSMDALTWQKLTTAAHAAALFNAIEDLAGQLFGAMASMSIPERAPLTVAVAQRARDGLASAVARALSIRPASDSAAPMDPLTRWASTLLNSPVADALGRAGAQATQLGDALGEWASRQPRPAMLAELERLHDGEFSQLIAARGSTAAARVVMEAAAAADRSRQDVTQQLRDSITQGSSTADLDALERASRLASERVDAAAARWQALRRPPQSSAT